MELVALHKALSVCKSWRAHALTIIHAYHYENSFNLLQPRMWTKKKSASDGYSITKNLHVIRYKEWKIEKMERSEPCNIANIAVQMLDKLKLEEWEMIDKQQRGTLVTLLHSLNGAFDAFCYQDSNTLECLFEAHGLVWSVWYFEEVTRGFN